VGDELVKKVMGGAKKVAAYQANLLISDFIEERPTLAPTENQVKHKGPEALISEKGAWGWDEATNQWEPPGYSVDKNAMQLFIGACQEKGMLVGYVKYLVHEAGDVFVSDEEGDTDVERGNKLSHNMGMLIGLDAITMTRAAFKFLTAYYKQEGIGTDDERESGLTLV